VALHHEARGAGKLNARGAPQRGLAPARELVDRRERVCEHRRLAQRRQQDRGAEPCARGDRGEVGERGERLEARLGDHAVAHPQIEPGLVAAPGERPALLERRPPRGIEHHRAVRQEHPQSHRPSPSSPELARRAGGATGARRPPSGKIRAI
jgi:hypothetical protein